MENTTLVLNTSETFAYGGATTIPPMHVARLTKEYAELVKRDYSVMQDVPKDEEDDYADLTINSAIQYANYVKPVETEVEVAVTQPEPVVEPVVETEPVVEPVVETTEPEGQPEPPVETVVETEPVVEAEVTTTEPEGQPEPEVVETVPTSDTTEDAKPRAKRGKS